LADDATWETPEGAFHGKDELRRYLNWLAAGVPDLKITETGVGIVVQGNRAAFEHVMQGTFEGVLCTWLAICTYEFAGDKVQKVRTVNDRLTILNQAAKGWLEGPIVHSLVKRAEKGL
jgi:SnoaL-like domain